ncbi:MAG: DMT family transporter [Pseudomonadota bacterium]
MSLPFLSALLFIVLVAFAANSVLGRVALEDGLIDAACYTAIRLASGAGMLALLVRLQSGRVGGSVDRPRGLVSAASIRASLGTAFALFVYAAFFSFAYLELGAALGALVLFAAVQITMIGHGIATGSRLGPLEWAGVAVAIGGFIYLVAPGIVGLDGGPPFGATLLMILSGVAWGAYSIAGRGALDPLGATARNFLLATPMGLVIVLVFASSLSVTTAGAVLAIVSGAITSGLGYALWYRALPFITSTVAAVLQLTVPVIAAFGGILFLGEALGWRFAISSIAILGGVAATVLGGKTERARKAR